MSNSHLLSAKMFTTPEAARRKAYGSFEPDGTIPPAKNDNKLSNLSAKAKTLPKSDAGNSPSAEIGM